MSSLTPQLRKLIAVLGTLVMVVGLSVVVGRIQPTEASWAEQVHGESGFSAGKPYARATSAYGTMFPYLSSDTKLGPNQAYVGPGALISQNWRDQRIGETDFSGMAGFLPIEAYNRSCAQAGSPAIDCLVPSPSTRNTAAYAVAETGMFKMTVGSIGGVPLITIGHTGNLNSARTTAECRVGEVGVPGLNSAGEVILGGDFKSNGAYDKGGTVIKMPALNGTTRGSSSGLYRYTATITHTSDRGINHASSRLRMHVTSTTLFGTPRWTLDMTLAHAECGTALRKPAAPERPAREDAWPTTRMATMQAAAEGPAALQPIADLTDDRLDRVTDSIAGEADSADDTAEVSAGLPTLNDAVDDEQVRGENKDRVNETSTSATTTPVTTAPAAPTTAATATATEQAEPEPSTAAPETSEPMSSESAEASEPTKSSAVSEGPQEPQSVREGREFAVVNREGIELGTAKVEDIVRTPECGVELTLSITTSAEAGIDRWASVGPDDFAEVRPGGSIREAKRMSSDCAQSANSRTTALSPGREDEIVIAFALDDSAQRAMLRPDGTAGWMFDLPPLPRVSTTKPTPTTSPQAVAPTSSPSATTSAVTEEAAAATAQA